METIVTPGEGSYFARVVNRCRDNRWSRKWRVHASDIFFVGFRFDPLEHGVRWMLGRRQHGFSRPANYERSGQSESFADANSHAYANSHPNANSNTEPYTHSWSYSHSESDSNTHPDAHSNSFRAGTIGRKAR